MISRYGIFCKIIETGSFTKTAELLGYSQSAVSQTIKALEQETGTTLINRRKDGTLLTVDGAAYLPYFQQIYQAEEALERKEREMRGAGKQCYPNRNLYQCQPKSAAGAYEEV